MYKYLLSACLIGGAFVSFAHAESDLYVTGGVSLADIENLEVKTLTLRGGWTFNDYLGAEIEGSVGVDGDNLPGGNGDLDMDAQYGAFLVGRTPIGPNTNLFARIGYARTELDVGSTTGSRVIQNDGLAYGGGAEFMFSNEFGIRGEYTRYEEDDGPTSESVDAVTLSAVYKFGTG